MGRVLRYMPYTRSAPGASGRESQTRPVWKAVSSVSWLITFRCAASSTLLTETSASAATARSRSWRSCRDTVTENGRAGAPWSPPHAAGRVRGA